MDTAGGGVGAGVCTGVSGVTVSSSDGCWLACPGAVALAEALEVASIGLGILYFTIKLSKVISGGVAGSEEPLPSGFTNSQISLASAWVLTAVSQVSHY